MILREIVHTCSNPHVARAALASIGGEFAARFAAGASRRNMPAGALAALMVREFSTRAENEEWVGVHEAVRGSEQPILTGLRYILSRGLQDEMSERGARTPDLRAPLHLHAAPAHYCCV